MSRDASRDVTLLLRLLSRLPLPVLYALAHLLRALVFRGVRARRAVVADNLARAFPELDANARAALVERHGRVLAEVAAETVKAWSLAPAALRARVEIAGLDEPRARLARGESVLLLAAHVGNWEWLMLALSLELGHPLEAVYKPLRSASAERAFLALRTRFGAKLVPAKQIVAHLRGPGAARAVAMLADQVPVSTPSRLWMRFLNQDTAFYLGPEEIARAAGLPVYYVAMERSARGRYRARVEPLGLPTEAPRELTRRYVQRLEAQIRAQPADWLWGHRRWKLRKPLYAR